MSSVQFDQAAFERDAGGLTEEQSDRFIQRHRRDYNYIECCGKRLYVPGFTNTCPQCHADYNWAGQRLASRSQWGEETGEHPADIARLP